jgi:hypothetical protein
MLSIQFNLENTNWFFNNLQIRLQWTRICSSHELISRRGLFHLMLSFYFIISCYAFYFVLECFSLLFLLFIKTSLIFFILLSRTYWIALLFNFTYNIFFERRLLMFVRFRLYNPRSNIFWLQLLNIFFWSIVILKRCLDIFIYARSQFFVYFCTF